MSALRKFLNSVRSRRYTGNYECESDFGKSDSDSLVTAEPVDANAETNLLPNKGGSADRIFKTICLFYSAVTLGWCTPILGNTLVHLQYLFHVSATTMSFALTVQAVGGLIGAILCGLIFDHVNPELAFAIASLVQGLSHILAPYIGGLEPFMIAVCVQATSIGFILTSGQSYCVRIWKDHRYRDPILHTWHAMWSLGAMIGPFIVARFLVDLPQQHMSASNEGNTSASLLQDAASNTFNGSLTTPSSSSLNPTPVVTRPSPLYVNVSGVEKVCYAYVTIGSLCLILPFLFAIAFFLTSSKSNRSSSEELPSSPSSTGSNADGHSPSSPESDSDDSLIGSGVSIKDERKLYLIFLLQVFLFYHLYRYGITIPYMYLTSFVIHYLNFPVQKASLLMSLFFASQFVSRVIGIPVAAFVQPIKMLIFNVSSTAVSFVLLLSLINVWPTIVWIAAPLASFSLSTTFASAMLWISDRITITGRISSFILIGHSSGGIVGPLIVGQLFERSTPMWFAYSTAGSSVLQVVLMIVLIVYDARHGDRVKAHAHINHVSIATTTRQLHRGRISVAKA